MRYKPGDVIDHYEIVEELGEGAYAEAYKARDIGSGSIVMLKLPNPLMFADPQVYARFQRETEIAQRLDDAGVQKSLGLRSDGSEPYLVLEFVEGETLRREMQSFEGHVPVDLALEWLRQLARAIAYLHSRGITHRDLKPENVLVAMDGTVKVVDFGTALATGARRLTWRHLTDGVGTPDYMSPEQIQGERGDPRSDIYSWGIIAYELLAGRVPFDGDNWLAVMAGHLQRAPHRIRDLRPDVPPALEAVVLHAMRRYPEHRYQTAEALVADLDSLETLDPSSFDLSVEKPMGGMSSAATPAQLWRFIALIAIGFFVLLAIVVVLTRGFR